jgi:hypothetical protein
MLAAVLTLASGCFRPETLTAEIRVPALRSETAAALVYEAFSAFPAEDVKVLSVDRQAGTVRVSYDSTRVALRNLQHRLAAAGFDADDIPANPDARQRLPEDCR